MNIVDVVGCVLVERYYVMVCFEGILKVFLVVWLKFFEIIVRF